jgi:hypothetical protein
MHRPASKRHMRTQAYGHRAQSNASQGVHPGLIHHEATDTVKTAARASPANHHGCTLRITCRMVARENAVSRLPNVLSTRKAPYDAYRTTLQTMVHQPHSPNTPYHTTTTSPPPEGDSTPASASAAAAAASSAAPAPAQDPAAQQQQHLAGCRRHRQQ